MNQDSSHKRTVYRIAQSVANETVAKNAPKRDGTAVANLASDANAATIAAKVNELLGVLREQGVIKS